MTEKELFEKNLELASEFSRYVIAHPEVSEKLSPNAEILFLVDSEPELSKKNLELAKRIKKEGGFSIFVHIKKILPKNTCRLVKPRIESLFK